MMCVCMSMYVCQMVNCIFPRTSKVSKLHTGSSFFNLNEGD